MIKIKLLFGLVGLLVLLFGYIWYDVLTDEVVEQTKPKPKPQKPILRRYTDGYKDSKYYKE